MPQQATREEVANRKDSPHKSGSDLGVSKEGGAGAIKRVGKTQFGEGGSARPEAMRSASPIYGNQMLQDLELLEVDASELKAADLGEAYTELFSLAQKYPGLNPKAYLSELDVNVVSEADASGGGGSGGVLYVQWAPTDLESPNLSGDLDALQNSDTQVHAALNPSWTGLQNLVDSGSYTSVVISGHGQSDSVTATDDAGLSDSVTAEEVLSLLDGSAIQNVVLSAAAGSAGLATMGSQLEEAGMRVMHFMDAVGADSSAGSLSALIDIANQMGAPGFSGDVFKAAAAQFDGSGGALIARLMDFEAGNADLEEIATMLDAFVPQAKSKLEDAGAADLDAVAKVLAESKDEEGGDEGKAVAMAESELEDMTVSMGSGLVESMP